MRELRTAVGAALVVALLLLLSGCLELTGQRITVRYDQAGDRLFLLIRHDGIHENRRRDGDAGKEQLEEYIANGDVMFLDWFFYLHRDEIQTEIDSNAANRPAFRELARTFIEEVESRAIGHYVDPEGRIGAAQLLVIPKAREFLGKVNAMLSELIVEMAESRGHNDLKRNAPLTYERLLRAAGRDHPWISLTGHALTLSFPVNRAEWAALKVELLVEWFGAWNRVTREQELERGKINPACLLQLIASESVTLAELGDVVNVTLGGTGEPQTLRVVLRDEYNTDLEAAVRKSVPASLDDLLAAHLLGAASAKTGSWQEMVIACSAPEDRVRAVLSWSDKPEFSEKADAWLRAFAEKWNRDVGGLPAPAGDATAGAWGKWYLRMLSFPSTRRRLRVHPEIR